MSLTTIETCGCTWVFDTAAMRFRQVLRDIEVDGASVSTEWRPYVRLKMSAEGATFTVYLTTGGTRMIRSSKHVGECDRCRPRSQRPSLAAVDAN